MYLVASHGLALKENAVLEAVKHHGCWFCVAALEDAITRAPPLHNLVARLQHRLEQAVQGVSPSTAGQHLVHAIAQAVILLDGMAYGLAQFRYSSGGGISGFPIPDGLEGRFLDIFRGVEIRLANPEADNVGAAGPQFLGLGVDGQGDRRLDICQSL